MLYQLYRVIPLLPQVEQLSIVLILFIAWVINMTLVGAFAFMGFTFPTEKLMPAVYYEIHRPHLLRRVYQFFRVDLFRKILLKTLWRSKKQRAKFFNKKRDGINQLITQSQKAEFGHFIPMIILLFGAIVLVFVGAPKLACCITLFNFIGNFYPVLLQRYHRLRVKVLQTRFNKLK